ncbi:hypothetical protein HanRHA438_Chr09g0395371 [Helianthus annuus]|nr:hypothetical protein HanIR_Chr09g0413891 [Helianthus annuus]KAJ0887833.1 hypothetical protein HanRHA438_Chr09g0395371 [Helianthus annuus]
MFTPNYRRYPLSLKLTGFVLNVSKSCTVCPLSLTQFIFFFLLSLINQGYFCLFTHLIMYFNK